MHAIQTIKQGGYKLALGFTALVAAFTLSMGAQASAWSMSGLNAYNNYGTEDYATWTYHVSPGCSFSFYFGQYGHAAYSNIRVTNSGGTGCQVITTVYSTTGAYTTDSRTTWNTYSYTGWAQASLSYSTFSRADFQVWQGGAECTAGFTYTKVSGFNMGQYQGTDPCVEYVAD